MKSSPMHPPSHNHQSPFGRHDMNTLCAMAISPKITTQSEDIVRTAHFCHLGGMLLSPTHPQAAKNLRDVGCQLEKLSGITLSNVGASWIMKTYDIGDLAPLRDNLILQIGSEDRQPCVKELTGRDPGIILIDLDLPAGKALLDYLEALERRLSLSDFQKANGLEPVSLFMTGGLLAHLYTGLHPVYAIEAEFGSAIPCPPDLVIDLVDRNGLPQVAYLDLTVATEKGLWHPDARQVCLPIYADIKGFDLTVPRPIDLAVNMCTRLTQSEGLWIDAMARRHLFTADEFRDHAAQALLECELDDAQIKCIEKHVELAATLVERAQMPKSSPKGSRRPT